MKTLYISAGHSPDNVGAVVGGIKEYDLNQKIADARINGVLVPTGTLRSKIDWVNERATPDDLAIEIHHNTNNYPSKRGVEVYYADDRDKELAIALDRAVSNKMGSRLGGTHKLDEYRELGCSDDLGAIVHDSLSAVGSLGWCRQIKCPAVILEVGYMTNPSDLDMILSLDTPRIVAEAIDSLIKGEDVRTLSQKVIDLQQLVGLLLREIIRLTGLLK